MTTLDYYIAAAYVGGLFLSYTLFRTFDIWGCVTVRAQDDDVVGAGLWAVMWPLVLIAVVCYNIVLVLFWPFRKLSDRARKDLNT